MGTQNKMYTSIDSCANFVFKLHSTVIENIAKDIELYPVMDGVYITSKSQKAISKFLTSIFYSVTDMFITASNHHKRFFIKASMAYGPRIHGKALPSKVNDQFDNYLNYKNSILLGLPMVQAYANEKNSPPFGVYIHESARAFSPQNEKPFSQKWWQWFRFIPKLSQNEKQEYVLKLLDSMEDYYNWASNNDIAIDYKSDRIQEHRKMAEEYFKLNFGNHLDKQ